MAPQQNLAPPPHTHRPSTSTKLVSDGERENATPNPTIIIKETEQCTHGSFIFIWFTEMFGHQNSLVGSVCLCPLIWVCNHVQWDIGLDFLLDRILSFKAESVDFSKTPNQIGCVNCLLFLNYLQDPFGFCPLCKIYVHILEICKGMIKWSTFTILLFNHLGFLWISDLRNI